MIQFQGAIWMAPEPADMRKGIDGLSLQVRASLGHNPCAGDAFLFRNRAGNRIKILLWDGTGVWLCQRRLHRGTFTWASKADENFTITREEWDWLIRGVDWQRLNAPPRADWEP
jgi:transposase